MQHRFCNILFFLFFFTSCLVMGQTHHVLLRRHYTLNAENQKVIEKADQIYAEIINRLNNYPEKFSITHIDSVQKFLGTSLLKTYTQDIPLQKLLAVQDHFHIQSFFYFDLLKSQNAFYLHMQGVEFPSNVLINSYQVPITEKSNVEKIADDFMRQFSIASPSLLGHPFSQGRGMVYIYSSDTEYFTEHIAIFDTWLKRTNDRLYIKIIKSDAAQPINQQTFEQCNADVVLMFNNAENMYVWQKLDSLSQHPENMILPLWPTDIFHTLSVLPDARFPNELLKAWLPDIQLLRSQELYKTLSQQNAAAVSIAALYNLSPFIDSASKARVRNMQHHYQQLFDYFFNDPKKLGWITLNSAALNQKINEPERALSGYKSAELAFMESGDSYMQLYATLQQADIFTRMHDHRSAINTLQSSLVLAKQNNAVLLTAQIQEKLGDFFAEMDQPLDAWLAWESAISHYSQESPEKAIPICLKTARLLDKPEYGTNAEQFYQKGLELAIETKNLQAQAQFRKYLGYFYKNKNSDKAQLHFSQAIDDLEILGDKQSIAQVDVEIGSLYAKQKKYRRAKTHYYFAYNYFQSVQNDSARMHLLINIGDMLTALNRWKRAEWTLRQALYYAEKLTNQQQLVSIYYKMGLAQIQGGDYDNGLKSIKLARMLNDGEPPPGIKDELMLNEIKDLLKDRK